MTHSHRIVFLSLAALILVFYTNCSRDTFSRTDITSVGNPPVSPVSTNLVQNICTLLNHCNSGLSINSCQSGILATGGIGESLGLPNGTYPTFNDVEKAEQNGAISGVSANAQECENQVANASCANPKVQAAYAQSAPQPYSGVAQLLGQVSPSCSQSFSGITLVQKAAGTLPAWNTSIKISTPAASLAGDFMVVAVGDSRGVAPIQVTDNLGQSYAVAISNTSGRHVSLYYRTNSASGVNSITVNYPSGTDAAPCAIVAEFAGLASKGTLDQVQLNNNNGGSVSSWTSNSTTATSQASEILIGAAETWNGPFNLFPGTGWTILTSLDSADGGYCFMEYKVVSQKGTYAATGSFSVTQFVISLISTFY